MLNHNIGKSGITGRWPVSVKLLSFVQIVWVKERRVNLAFYLFIG